MMKLHIIILSFLCLSIMAESPNQNPPIIREYFGNASKVGEGTVYKFIIAAYDISLWSNPLPWSYKSTFALQVKVKWNASQAEMVDSTMEAMERTQKEEGNPLSIKTLTSYTKLLYSFYPALKDKDTITVIYLPNKMLRFYHNDKHMKDVTDMKFAKAFCDIWLSPKTKFTSAREDMLNKK